MKLTNSEINEKTQPLKPGDELYEIRYIAELLNVSERRVQEAMQQVGNDRQKIEEYFKEKK